MNPSYLPSLFVKLTLIATLLQPPLFQAFGQTDGEDAFRKPQAQWAPFSSFEPFLKQLNEFEGRRRVKTFFENGQPVFYGAQAGLVNVGRGNLTFVRRDLVAVGRMPLVAARVYDSSLASGYGFGRGWRLTAAETIELGSDGGVVLWHESAARIRYARVGEAFVQVIPTPTDILDFRQVDPNRIEIKLRVGTRKEFTRASAADPASGGGTFYLTGVEDRNGNRTTLHYQAGKLIRIQAQNRRAIHFHWEAGRIALIRDDQDRRVSYRYNSNGQLAEVADLGGHRWRYQYDERGRMTRSVNPLDHDQLRVIYDGQGRVAEIDSPTDRRRFAYLPNRTLVADGLGRQSEYRQDANGITTSIRNALGVVTRLELDERNRVRNLFRNDAVQAEIRYDDDGRPASLTTYDGGAPRALRYAYTQQGWLARITGPGVLIWLRYDERGNLIERTGPDGWVAYGYAEKGDLVEIRAPHARFQPPRLDVEDLAAPRKKGWEPGYRFEYDEDGQIASMVNQRGERLELRRAKSGKLVGTQFADGSTQDYAYDSLGMRRLRQDSDGGRVTYAYSAVGGILHVEVVASDGELGGQTIGLDQDQRVAAVQNFHGEELLLRYDEAGNVTAFEEGEKITAFRYDGLNRLYEIHTPEGDRLSYRYADGEPDIRRRADSTTRWNPSSRITSGLTFGSALEVLHNRTVRSEFGLVRLDQAMVDYRLVSDWGVLLPDAEPLDALARMRIMPLADHGKDGFAMPSNVLFIPPEYASINCCNPMWCTTCSPEPYTRCSHHSWPPSFNCCTNGCDSCKIKRSGCLDKALIAWLAAIAACIPDPCIDEEDPAEDCVTCLGAASAAYGIAVLACDLEFHNVCVPLYKIGCQATGITCGPCNH